MINNHRSLHNCFSKRNFTINYITRTFDTEINNIIYIVIDATLAAYDKDMWRRNFNNINEKCVAICSNFCLQ